MQHHRISSIIQEFLEYLLHLKHSGLLLSLLWVHLAAISMIDQSLLFSHTRAKRFLKNVLRFYLVVNDLVSVQDLNLVL